MHNHRQFSAVSCNIMKPLHFITLLIFSINSYSFECYCDSEKDLDLYISCDTINFTNNSFLYRQFNCDSSWLTYENKNGIKKILYALQAPLIDYTERLGYQFEFEYKSTFLIRNRLISGCCKPPEFLLFNKQSGNIVKKFGRLIYHSELKNLPIVAYLNQKDLNSIIIYNFDTKVKKVIELPKNVLINTVRQSNFMLGEDLFEETVYSNGKLIFTYKFQNKGNTTKWFTKKVSILI